MKFNLRTLGPAESRVALSFREQGRTVVRDILGSETTTRIVIRNLTRKGWLSRIVSGKYMLLPPEHGPEDLGENNVLALAAAAVEPSYIGWWSAAAWLHHTEAHDRLRRGYKAGSGAGDRRQRRAVRPDHSAEILWLSEL